MKDYKAKVKQYQPDADVDNGIVAYGWTQGALLVETLKGLDTAGRAELMNALRSMDGSRAASCSPASSVTTGDDDPFMGETFRPSSTTPPHGTSTTSASRSTTRARPPR